MTKTATLYREQEPTDEQIQMIEAAATLPVVYDEDSSELSPAMEKSFRLAARYRNNS